MTFSQKLIEGAKKINIEMSERQAYEFETYMNLLLEFNEKMNLTAITDRDEIIVKHFLDSITPLAFMKFEDNSKIIDVGTGAGFPSIPLKIMLPNVSFTLLDSLNKRIDFLEEVISQLGLEKIEAIHCRAEEYGQNKNHREKYDFAVSRAVANLQVLSEFCLPFVKIGGKFIALKGKNVHEEIESGKNAIEILGSKISKIEKIELPYSDISHEILFIDKITEINEKYPRSYNKIKKNPL